MNINILYACCRNNWHIHHHAVQVLVCVSGRGWYQEWGKGAVELTPGFRTELMEQREQSDARINSAESRLKSSETQWLEPVDDELFTRQPPITPQRSRETLCCAVAVPV